MFKLFTLIFGVLLGGGGASAWWLSLPKKGTAPSPSTTSNPVSERIAMLRSRLQVAMDEGKRAGHSAQLDVERRWQTYSRGRRA